MKKIILITGIKGFLATHIADYLSKKYAIYGIGKESGIYNGISVFSSENLESISIKPDFIIICHAAVESGHARLPSDLMFAVNVSLTKKIVEQFKLAKIIYVSTASVYDSSTSVISESSPINPQSEYAVSKLWAEKIVLQHIESVVVRPSSLYGIGMRENTIIPNYVAQALSEQQVEVWGKGERMQNYIHVDDATKFIDGVIAHFDSVASKVLLMVNNEEWSNKQLALIVAKSTKAILKFVNDDASRSLRYDNSLTCRLLNWLPASNFEIEINKYIQWKIKQF